jgi:hypothetical protein
MLPSQGSFGCVLLLDNGVRQACLFMPMLQTKKQIARVAQDGRFDYVLIESTGASEPMQAAESFTMQVETTDQKPDGR